MSTPTNNFDREIQKFESELQKHNQEFETKKREMNTLEQGIKDAERLIIDNKHKIEALKPRLRELEREQKAAHDKIAQIELKNRTMLHQNGVKVDPLKDKHSSSHGFL